MRRVVDGLAGWITYYQACGTGRHYDEHVFYQHVDNLAAGRGWRVLQQEKIAGQGTPGAPSSVDFVIYRRPVNPASREGLLFLEVKYLRGDNPSQDLGNLWDDVTKLRPLTPSGLVCHATFTQCGPPAKFLLVVGQVGDLQNTLNPLIPAVQISAASSVFDYIEMFYNPKRKHVRNGMLSPVEFERQQEM